MLMIALSRILGLVRYRLLAHFFGGELHLLDSFIAASLIPETIFDVFIFGTIAITFIPVFSTLLAQKREDDAWRLVWSLLMVGVIIFTLASLVVFILAPQIAFLIAPGQVARNKETVTLIADLVRIMLISQIFFVPGTILTGVSQTFRYFFIPALAPVIYNLSIIVSIVLFSNTLSIYAPALGMIFGAVLFFLIQLPLAKKVGLRFLGGKIFTPEVVRVFALSLPRTATLIINRANDLVNVALASLVSTGSIVVFNFAQTLNLAPVGIFGASLAQAILPTFSIIYGKQDLALFRRVFLSTFHQLLFIILPISAILAVLRIPLVRLVYGASNFPWEATVLTGQVLIIFSFSLFAQVLNLLFARAFYAMHDTKTPLFITAVATSTNIILSVFFIVVRGLSIHYLALSFSLTSILQAVALFILLSRKLGGFGLIEISLPIIKILVASFLMAIALYIPMKILDQLVFDTTRTIPLILLTSIAGFSGLSVYAFLAWLFNIGQIAPIIAFVRRFGKIDFERRKTREEVEVINGGSRLNP